MYARFRKRITFPIANEAGKVIAFTARALDPDEKTPKYLNSPETSLYSKGAVLFNLDKAKSAMRSNDFALLVEGQMDCISVYMAGIHNVLAVSGTAFTEQQVRLLGRFTKRVIVNFDPDTAGANAAEKSIALLTEDDFDIKIVTLEGGLDPDRFVREQGVQAYGAALRGARRYSDYLIDRARQLFPARTADAKVKSLNFLLPHIRRMPNPIQRDEFAADAAQKLGIDSALMRQELKSAAAQRTASIPQHRAEPLTETERILLRALVLPESDSARVIAAIKLSENPAWIADLATADLLDVLAHAPAPSNPLDAASTDELRAHLALALQHAPAPGDPALTTQVEGALKTLERRRLERRQRELRSQIAEADRRGDNEMLGNLMTEKVHVDRTLRDC
jgi:DNA primase